MKHTGVGGFSIYCDCIDKQIEILDNSHRGRTLLKLEIKIKVNWKSRKTKDCQKTPHIKRKAWKQSLLDPSEKASLLSWF